jgi:transposase-like protein
VAKGKYQQWLTTYGLLKIQGWARDGLTDEQIAHNMGIAYSTLRVWKDKYQTLSATLKKGKEVVDLEVENALLKRALGYTYEEKHVENGQVKKIITKEVVPDTTAQIFWLKNRKPKYWRDRVELHEDDDDNVKAYISEMKK